MYDTFVIWWPKILNLASVISIWPLLPSSSKIVSGILIEQAHTYLEACYVALYRTYIVTEYKNKEDAQESNINHNLSMTSRGRGKHLPINVTTKLAPNICTILSKGDIAIRRTFSLVSHDCKGRIFKLVRLFRNLYGSVGKLDISTFQ